MQVKILDQTWHFPNISPIVGELFKKLEALIENSDFHLSHMVIDGYDLYGDYYDYIVEHIAEIQNIKIELKTIRQLADQLLVSAEQYLTGAIPQIGQLVNGFYRGPEDETWIEFDKLLEGILSILQITEFIEENQISYKNRYVYLEVLSSFKMILNNLSDAVKNKDTTLIGDLLYYEVRSLFELLNQEIQKTIDNEVVRDDLN